jgi:hypothetical protein
VWGSVVSMLYHIKKRHQMHSMFTFQITPRFFLVHTPSLFTLMNQCRC